MKDKTPIILIVVILFLSFLLFNAGGINTIYSGFLAGGNNFIRVIPLLLAAFLVAGLTQVLITKELVTKWLGREAGWKAIGLACIAGALIPGGPYVYYPIAAVLMHNGAGIGVLVSFVAAKNLWSVSRLPYEIALIGLEFTLVRFLLTLIFPPVLGWLSEQIFGSYMIVIREEAPKL